MKLEPLLAEACRLHLMDGLERRLSGAGYGRIAGVDEAGRGALAGPVVVAAVMMPPGLSLPLVDDSKVLAETTRESLAFLVRSHALAVSVEQADAREIDASDVLTATRRAMRRALLALRPSPDLALVDAVGIDELPFPSLALVRGDRISHAVACASIVAKVERDRLMGALDHAAPHYGLGRHKGYGAPEHLAALARFGPAPFHRLTFESVLPRRRAGWR